MNDNKKKSNRQYACQMARKFLGGDISKYNLIDNFPDIRDDIELEKLYKALTSEPKKSWLFWVTKEKHNQYVFELYKMIDQLEKI